MTVNRHPDDLLGDGERPAALGLVDVTTAGLGRRFGLRLIGPDAPVAGFAFASRASGKVTFLDSPSRIPDLAGQNPAAVLVAPDLVAAMPPGLPVLVVETSPREAFYQMLDTLAREGAYECLAGHVARSATIAPSAQIGDHVYIAEDVRVGPGAVILPNTYLGPGTEIKANATIGGDGFQIATLGGSQAIVRHAGGCWLSAGTWLGSGSCVDRGLFGDFTFLGPETKADNLVYLAHGSATGSRAVLCAGTAVMGSVELGMGVWLGPHTTVNQGLAIGDHAYVGSGSVVTRSLPRHTLAYGSPARAHALVCQCRTKLAGLACPACGKAYREAAGEITAI